MKKEKEEKRGIEMYWIRKIGIWAAIIIAAVILLRISFPGLSFSKLFENKEGKVTTVSKSSLQKMFEMSELSTLEYDYNSIAAVYDDEGIEKYHVAYEGTVLLGIDFDKLEVRTDKKKGKITIRLPEVKIQDVKVTFESMEYIFNHEYYETETVSQEAYKECIKDLRQKAEHTDMLYETARENTKDMVSALIEPLKKQWEPEFQVELIDDTEAEG